MQRFRGGLVFKAHRLCESLNSRLGSNKAEEKTTIEGPAVEEVVGVVRVHHRRLVLRVSLSTEMCSGSEAGSYLRLIDSCITQLKAQGPSRTCNENKQDEETTSPGLSLS